MNKTLKGGKRFVPNYIDSTFKTQEHKTEDGRNAVAVKQEKERKEKIFKESIPPYPLVELRVNDRIPEKKPPPELYPLPFVPIQNPLYPNAMMAPINMPLVKKYNITLSNLNGNLTNIGEIYEDILPKAAISQNRYTTLSERLVIANYFRSILIKRGDGEEVKIDGQKANEYTRERFEIHNLLSHINVMDINPYHKNSLTNNPYRTLPDNMVMFRSCYPIKYNTDNNVTPTTIIKPVFEIIEATKISEDVIEYVDSYTSQDDIIKSLENDMKEAAKNLEFEKAARLRDRIAGLKHQ